MGKHILSLFKIKLLNYFQFKKKLWLGFGSGRDTNYLIDLLIAPNILPNSKLNIVGFLTI